MRGDAFARQHHLRGALPPDSASKRDASACTGDQTHRKLRQLEPRLVCGGDLVAKRRQLQPGPDAGTIDLDMQAACTSRSGMCRKRLHSDIMRPCRIARSAEFGKICAGRERAPPRSQNNLRYLGIVRCKFESIAQGIAQRTINRIAGIWSVDLDLHTITAALQSQFAFGESGAGAVCHLLRQPFLVFSPALEQSISKRFGHQRVFCWHCLDHPQQLHQHGGGMGTQQALRSKQLRLRRAIGQNINMLCKRMERIAHANDRTLWQCHGRNILAIQRNNRHGYCLV